MKKVLLLILAFVLLLTGCAATPSDTTAATQPPTETTAAATTEDAKPKRLIALTFDDGPHVYMPKLLSVLEKYNAKATFFLVGKNITEETAQMVKDAYDAGHEIGNHSFSHERMLSMSADQVREEYSKVQEQVTQIIGEAPTLFRPPWLETNEIMFDVIDIPMISGRICDWDGATAEETFQKVKENVNDGRIILLHFKNSSIESLDLLLPWLYDYGFETVTVSELFERRGIDLSANDILYKDEAGK